MIKRILVALLSVITLQPVAALAGPGAAAFAGDTVSATVESVDKQTRHITLKKDDGGLVTLRIGEQAHNFDQIKAGDRFTFTYTEALVVQVKKTDEPLRISTDSNIERAPKGDKPSGTVSNDIT